MKLYKDLYDEGMNLQVFVDISTYCNAGCPECHRTEIERGGLGKVDWLPLVQWTAEEFMNAYEPEFVKKVKLWEICGTWGDPVMCKELYEICDYILDHNPYCELTIDTNGSIRPISWWTKMGELSKKCKGPRIRFDFAIEGINQEMQEKYRRKTRLDIILANLKAVTDAGAKAKGFCVIHKHNQDYLQEILDMCQSYGAETVDFVESNRFYNGPRFEFINEKYERDYLEQAEGDYVKPKYIRGAQVDWKTRTEFQPWFLEMQKKVSEVKDEEDIY